MPVERLDPGEEFAVVSKTDENLIVVLHGGV
jgi:hypothetical protein